MNVLGFGINCKVGKNSIYTDKTCDADDGENQCSSMELTITTNGTDTTTVEKFCTTINALLSCSLPCSIYKLADGYKSCVVSEYQLSTYNPSQK